VPAVLDSNLGTITLCLGVFKLHRESLYVDLGACGCPLLSDCNRNWNVFRVVANLRSVAVNENPSAGSGVVAWRQTDVYGEAIGAIP
jgi:hypothetical protein